MASTGDTSLENFQSSFTRDQKVVFGGELCLEFARNESRFAIWKKGPNTANVSPFAKRERALPTIGITLRLTENKNVPAV